MASSKQRKESFLKPGGHSLMVPPGPIPNPEVKHQHVDGSRTTGPARVDSCQGKRSPQNESSAESFEARDFSPSAVIFSGLKSTMNMKYR